jgi:GDPmannose 4,6-dehydratase
MKKKIALITGITGQDGSILAKFLINKNYIVHGIVRRSSSFNTGRLTDIYEDKNNQNKKLNLYYGDMIDFSNLYELVRKILPDEIYNLAAQSHVKVSYELPEYTSNADGLGVLRILEIIRMLKQKKIIKFYQASTSEMFGSSPPMQNENTKFNPVSPYGAAKLYAHHITKIYRDAFKIFACTGILFNHEGPFRGDTFVTQKIIKHAVRHSKGSKDVLFLGNIYAKRDWGDADEFVEGIWKIMQYKKPEDFVLATGKSYTIKQFINKVYRNLGIQLIWKGRHLNEIAINKKTNLVLIKINKSYYRPLEVNHLRGDYSKAKKLLKWSPKLSLDGLIKKMIKSLT